MFKVRRWERRAILVSQCLQLVSPKLVLVHQDVIVRRPGGALDGGVAVEEEIELIDMADGGVHDCAYSKQKLVRLHLWPVKTAAGF